MAVVYFAAGRIALLLAIPPGYASAVWPAAGLALAGVLLFGYRLSAGVLLGSFLTNIWTSFDPSSPASMLRSMLIPASIGVGAALQAMLGGLLVRRFVGHHDPLNGELKLVKLLALGGPVSCLVNATVGVSVLLATGAIGGSNYLFSWFTWWVGDSIGAMIFAPLALIWAPRPHPWPLRRQVLITLPLCLSFSLMVILFVEARGWEQKRAELDFAQRADIMVQMLTDNLHRQLDVLYSMRGLYASSPQVDRQAFRSFAQALLARHPGIQALEWSPRVARSKRRIFEAAAEHEGYTHFQITEQNAQHTRVRAGERTEYSPVEYVEPYGGNESALGFDLASEPTQFAALRRALETDRPAATAPFILVRQRGQQVGLLAFLRVHAHGAPDQTGEEGRKAPGCVVAVFLLSGLVEASLQGREEKDVEIRLYDQTAPRGQRLLYSNMSPTAGQSDTSADNEPGDRPGPMRKVTGFEMAGRVWMLQLCASQGYLVSHRSWQAWTVLVGGLLFTALLGALLLVMTGHTEQVENLVVKRTNELVRSNTELRRFAYVASHDLQEPLRAVAGFAQLLADRYKGKLDSDADDFIGFVVEGATRMQTLIEDLATFHWVGAQPAIFEPANCEEILDAVLTEANDTIRANRALVTRDALPTMIADRSQLTLLFQHLIGNALKFHGRDEPRIHVSAEQKNGAWVLSVEDNGIGIDPQFAERIFVFCQRLHSRSEYRGSGSGLAICKRIVENHDGRIWVESELGKGATFYFTLPITNNPRDSQMLDPSAQHSYY
jgi:signal transduction histidine kinase/sensor domain CHASE-containing protein